MEQVCFRSRLFRFAGLREGGLTAGARLRLPPFGRLAPYGKTVPVLHYQPRRSRGKAERPPPGQGAPAQARPKAGIAVSEKISIEKINTPATNRKPSWITQPLPGPLKFESHAKPRFHGAATAP